MSEIEASHAFESLARKLEEVDRFLMDHNCFPWLRVSIREELAKVESLRRARASSG